MNLLRVRVQLADQPGALALLKPVANDPGRFSQRRRMARGALAAGMRDITAAAEEYRHEVAQLRGLEPRQPRS